jgi:acyl carrier protein
MNIEERVKKVMAKHVNVDNLKVTDELKTLGLDSLDLVEVAMEIEEEFNIQFEMDDIAAFNTLGDVLKIIENKAK